MNSTGDKRSMKKVSISLLAVLCLLVSFAVATAFAEEGSVDRRDGEDRYETAALTAEDAFGTSEEVIIARGDDEGDFADGLAASVLAGALDAPILLVQPDEVPTHTEDAISDLEAEDAVVLGQTAAVSEGVVEDLEDLDLEVDRVGGEDRYETAALIAEEADEEKALADYAFIVNGRATPDALVSGAAAFRDQAPILQVSKGSVPEVTEDALDELGLDEVYLVGGEEIISDQAEDDIEDEIDVADRLAGDDRWGTSVEVAREKFEVEGDLVLSGGRNQNLVDAIGASGYELPILYTTSIPEVVQDYLDEVLTPDSRVTIMGGTAAVSYEVQEEVEEKIEEKDGKIISKEELDLNTGYEDQVKVQSIDYLSDGLTVEGFIVKPQEIEEELPVLIYNRGGNRDFGKIDEDRLARLSSWAAEYNYVILASQYRGVTEEADGNDQFGGEDVNDVFNIIQTAQNLDYTDNDNMVMFGGSRGGMMAHLAIKGNASLEAAVTIGSPTDLEQAYYDREEAFQQILEELIGGTPEEVPEEYESRSAVFWPEDIDVPLLMIHGSDDRRVDVSHSHNLEEELKALNKEYELIVYEDDDHGVSENWDDAIKNTFDWFEEHIDRP